MKAAVEGMRKKEIDS